MMKMCLRRLPGTNRTLMVDLETKQQFSLRNLSSKLRPKKARQRRNNVKAMSIAFFDYKVVVHHKYPLKNKKNITCFENIAYCSQNIKAEFLDEQRLIHRTLGKGFQQNTKLCNFVSLPTVPTQSSKTLAILKPENSTQRAPIRRHRDD